MPDKQPELRLRKWLIAAALLTAVVGGVAFLAWPRAGGPAPEARPRDRDPLPDAATPARGGNPADPPPPSEFSSLDEAREVQHNLRTTSDRVAPAVVALTTTEKGATELIREGSGVVIDASGHILTHGHHDKPRGTVLQARFADGRVVDAKVLSVYSGSERDYSLLKIQQAGRYPCVPLRRETPLVAGERCFHFGYPNDFDMIQTPLLRLGRIAGDGQYCTYANCLIFAGDSGGPLFDFQGRVIGVLDNRLGPYLAHPGQWANASKILDGTTYLNDFDDTETTRLGFLREDRNAIDTRRHVAKGICDELLSPARRATVEILIDDRPVVLGTIVDAKGVVLSKRSEILTHRGEPLGKVSCRLFDGETVSARVLAESHGDDLILLQLPKAGLTPAPWGNRDNSPRGTIVIVPVPGKQVSETGVTSVDREFSVEADAGHVQLKVEMRAAGVTVIGSNTPRGLDRFVKIIRGSIQAGDVITHIDGKECADLAAYQQSATNERFVAGDFVVFSIRRSGGTFRAAVPLESAFGDSITSREYAGASPRWSGFPAVVSHDTIVAREQCGGPVVDLEGRVVGMNIARRHRFSTLAIPQHVVRKRVGELLAVIK